MPEYLSPGVYVEEVSFRAKSIEGVSTSVAGFIGPTRYGPISGTPELLTSFADFARIYGGLDQLQFEGQPNPQDNYMAHAVRAFFDNGGSMLYVTRVFVPKASSDGHAQVSLGDVTLRARFPGQAGRMRVVFAVRASPNLLVADPSQPTGARLSVQANDVIYIKPAAGVVPGGTVGEGLYDVVRETGSGGEVLAYYSPSGAKLHLSDLVPGQHRVHRITLSVRARRQGQFEDEQTWPDLSPNPSARNALLDLFVDEPQSRLQYLTIPFAIEIANPNDSGFLAAPGARLVAWLIANSVQNVEGNLSVSLSLPSELSPQSQRPKPSDLEATYVLTSGGDDGIVPTDTAYDGDDTGPEKTGLKTFEDVDEISIVAAPGYSFDYVANPQRGDAIVQHLLTHCETMRYRVAVLDSPNDQVVSEIQEFRGKFDSKYAALYYPWVTIVDPLDPDGRREIELPPSGFVAGIYARTDVLHGVFKAPANEVVLGAVSFEKLLNKAQQDVLNPDGVNCFRFFEGRGFRLWGARTISSDPEWKYISVRRYFAYLEHSIDKGTQWAVFENNGPTLWANITQTVSDFLFNEWRNGALLGNKPEEAFFVRCDRTTMTQNDLDNGRLICLVGVAVVKPAEFVIFRIGQFTADHQGS